MKNYLLVLAGLVVGGLVSGFLFASPKPLGVIGPTTLGLGVNASVTATTSVKQAFPARDFLQFRKISNVGPYDVYWSGTSTNLDASTGAGILLRGSSSDALSGDSLYTGPIYTDALGTTTVSEGGL